VWVLIAVLALGMVAAGCTKKPAQSTQPAEQQKEEQYLNLNLTTEPPNLDPQLASDTVSFDILRKLDRLSGRYKVRL